MKVPPPAPTISSITPVSGPAGTVITIKGSNFGSGPVTLLSLTDNFNETLNLTKVNDTTYTFRVADNTVAGDFKFFVQATANGVYSDRSNAKTFLVTTQASGTTSPTTLPPGSGTFVAPSIAIQTDYMKVVNGHYIMLIHKQRPHFRIHYTGQKSLKMDARLDLYLLKTDGTLVKQLVKDRTRNQLIEWDRSMIESVPVGDYLLELRAKLANGDIIFAPRVEVRFIQCNEYRGSSRYYYTIKLKDEFHAECATSVLPDPHIR